MQSACLKKKEFVTKMESVATICQTTVLYVLIGLFLITTSIEAQQFTIEPESVVQAEGLLAEFECLSPGSISHPWFVNGVASTSLTSEIRVVAGSEGRSSVLIIPASSQFNNSIIQCAAVSLMSVGVLSRNAMLVVERVSIEIANDETSITVSVTNNFNVNNKWNNLTYRVDISLMTLGTNEMVTLPPLNGGQNQVQFNYGQTDNHTVCDIFTFTVTPFSESGMKGRSSEPVTGFFTTVTDNNITPLISQGGNVSRKIVHLGGMVPNCTSFTSYQVNSDISAPIHQTIENPKMIYFSLPTDQRTNISVTLTSIMGVRLIFKDMLIRTTDVQNLIVDKCPEENCARIEYVKGTLSPGALVCVIRIIDGEMDFQSIRLVPIQRNMSGNFTIPVALSGNYSVIAFDLENNNMSVPRMPMSVVADNETMFLSNKSSTEPNYPPNPEGIDVTKPSNGNAEVTCTTSGQSCLALFQLKISPTSLDPMVVVGFIEPPNVKTIVTLNTTSDVYVVVYTWNSDSGETIFDGKVSFISQLDLPTGPPSTQSPPDCTGSPIVTVVTVVIVFIAIIPIVAVVLYLVKRYKRGSKVLHSSCNHYQLEIHFQGTSTNIASQELDVSASQEEGIALYDVARPENMSPECNTADTDDAPPPGYDTICKENLPAEHTPTTSENPPPLPPPMLLGGSEAPDLPPPYNPAVDNESVAVDLSIYEREVNQSVLEGEVVEAGDASQGGEAENGGDSGQEEKIAAQHQYMQVETTPSSNADKVVGMTTVVYSEVDKDKLVPVVQLPVAKTQGQYTLVATKPASSDAKVIDSTKVVYAEVDKDKLKPVDPNDPPTLPPRRLVTNTGELHAHREDTSPSTTTTPSTHP